MRSSLLIDDRFSLAIHSLREEELFQDIWSCDMYDDGATVVSLHADLMPYYVQMLSCPFCVNVNPLTVYLPGAWDLCSLTVMHFPSENLYVLTGVLGPQNSCLTKIKKVRSLISLFCNPARRDPGILPSFMLIVTAFHLLAFRPSLIPYRVCSKVHATPLLFRLIVGLEI